MWRVRDDRIRLVGLEPEYAYQTLTGALITFIGVFIHVGTDRLSESGSVTKLAQLHLLDVFSCHVTPCHLRPNALQSPHQPESHGCSP